MSPLSYASNDHLLLVAAGFLAAARCGDKLNARQLSRITGDLDDGGIIDKVVCLRGGVARTNDRIALCRIAGLGIGAVLGLAERTERNGIRCLVGEVRDFGIADREETANADNRALGRHGLFGHRVLFMHTVLANFRLQAGIPTIVLVDSHTTAGKSRNRSCHHKFLHFSILLFLGFVFDEIMHAHTPPK